MGWTYPFLPYLRFEPPWWPPWAHIWKNCCIQYCCGTYKSEEVKLVSTIFFSQGSGVWVVTYPLRRAPVSSDLE